MSKEHDSKASSRWGVQSWELEMVKNVCRAFRTEEPEELEAELARKLAELKGRTPLGIRTWDAFLAKFLYNKASNWVRNARNRHRINGVLSLTIARGVTGISGRSLFEECDLRIALIAVWKELDPERQRFWEFLAGERGNQLPHFCLYR